MAKKKHRKLFPTLASETNKTLDCSIGICNSICPYNCYPEPDYYSISPQLSPWSSPHPILPPSPSTSAIYEPSENSSTSSDAITIITITGAVLAVLCIGLFIVAKFVSASVNRVNHERYQSDDDDMVLEEAFQDREQVDHPIWLIRTTGLQQSIINSITICNYKRGDGLIERTDCPVCLSEFEEDESLRLLPKCNHAFHISCIDTWLRSHTNCPLCRAGIAISIATPRCSVQVDVNPGGSGSNVGDDGVGEEDHGQIENRAELERDRDESDFKDGLSSSDRDLDTDQNSDLRIEISEFVKESNRNPEDVHGDQSETETKEKVRVFGECMDSSGGDSINSLLHSKTHKENIDFPGNSCETQSQRFTKPIKEEASCSEGNGSHNVQSWRRSDSIDSGESNGEATEDHSGRSQSNSSSNTLKTTGISSVSCFNKNKSSIFPL